MRYPGRIIDRTRRNLPRRATSVAALVAAVAVGAIVGVTSWAAGASALFAVVLACAVTVAVAALLSRARSDAVAERDRLGHLFAASQALVHRLTDRPDLDTFLYETRDMLAADVVEVVFVHEGHAAVHDSAGRRAILLAREGGPARSADSFVARRDARVSEIFPIGPGASHGVIAVHRRSALSETERELTAALAAQLETHGKNQRLFDKATQADRRRADFVAMAAHELRGPLTPLKGFVAALLEGVADDAESRREHLTLMSRQVDRLERLVDDLLNVAQVEARPHAVRTRSVDLGRLLEDYVRERGERHFSRRVEFRVPSRPVVVRADPFRVEQVVANLLSNALTYSSSEEPVQITVDIGEREAVVSIADRGPGIPEPDRERIFDAFYRGERGLSARPGGAGLGLYVTRRLVQAMGGRIWVTPRDDGSTFAFSLPAAAADRSASELRTRSPAVRRG